MNATTVKPDPVLTVEIKNGETIIRSFRVRLPAELSLRVAIMAALDVIGSGLKREMSTVCREIGFK